jgi:hypothetical protein
LSDDTFIANVNEVGKRIFFFAAPMYDEFFKAEVLMGMAECLSQSLAGAALSPEPSSPSSVPSPAVWLMSGQSFPRR